MSTELHQSRRGPRLALPPPLPQAQPATLQVWSLNPLPRAQRAASRELLVPTPGLPNQTLRAGTRESTSASPLGSSEACCPAGSFNHGPSPLRKSAGRWHGMPKRVAGTEGLLGRGDFGANTVTVQDEPRGRLFRPLKTPHEDTEQGCPCSRVREMIAKTRQPASAWCRGAPQMSSGSEVGAGAALGFHNTLNEKKKKKRRQTTRN